MSALDFNDLRVAYDNKVIIENLTSSIEKGKITSIIGPNGCGKSTLIKSISRILNKQSGRVLINGHDLEQLSGKEIARELAFLAQITSSPEGITVRELVAYGRFPYQKPFSGLEKEDTEYIDWALRVSNLKEIENERVDSLSGGQRQRVWIAMALAQGTDIIVLDEPTTYLDISYQIELLNLLKTLNEEKNKTILMVLHDINQAAKYSHNIIAMKKGEIIAKGSPREVINKENLNKIYGVKTDLIYVDDKPICINFDV